MFKLIVSILGIMLIEEAIRVAYKTRLRQYVCFEMQNGEIDVGLVNKFGRRDLSESPTNISE